MLTRLKVSGFKNLVDVDVHFGPFTCIFGANGVGKSNLFDAITFLSALADKSLVEAAMTVRDENGRNADVKSLFHRFGDEYVKEMRFEAEMIIPKEGQDDLGQKIEASITFLRYVVEIAYREEDSPAGVLELKREELIHINLGDASKVLLFPHNKKTWRKSVLSGHRGTPFISTEKDESGQTIIKLRQDGGGGRSTRNLAAKQPRTVISAISTAEAPTVLLARREMQSWRLLQLEPSALRKTDDFIAPAKLGMDGAHLAATLYRLAKPKNGIAIPREDQGRELRTYSRVANRLAELIDGVKSVGIDRDEKRELLTLFMAERGGIAHSARALSDGTLRFLALVVLELDTEASGVLCLEEPENGIHPARIPAMLTLLQDIATDVDESVGSDNPLRQVIINTHSPSVVISAPDDSILLADPREVMLNGKRSERVIFRCLSDTWRDGLAGISVMAKSALLPYFSPVPLLILEKRQQPRRVVDRREFQPYFPNFFRE